MIPNDRQIKNKAELEVQVLFCCREGEINYLKQLLKRTYVTKESSIPKYINVNEPLGLLHKYALHVATEHNRLNIIQYLVEQADAVVDIRTKKNGDTALMIAATNGYVNIVKYLVIHGANIDYQRSGGFTALTDACDAGQLETVRFLVESGAEKNTMVIHSRTTPITRALLKGHYEVVKYLYDHNASFSFEKLENSDLIKEVKIRFDHYFTNDSANKERPKTASTSISSKIASGKTSKAANMPLENEEVQNTNDGQDELNSDDSEPREPLVSKKLSASNTASIVSELEPAGGQNNKDSISEERNDAGRVATPDVDSNIQSTPLIDQYLQTNSTDSAAMNRNKIFLSAHLIPPVHVVPNATVSPEINQKSVGSDSNVPNSIAGMGKPKVIIPQHNLIPSTTSGSPNYFAKENVSLRRGRKSNWVKVLPAPATSKTVTASSDLSRPLAYPVSNPSSTLSSQLPAATATKEVDYRTLYFQQLKQFQELDRSMKSLQQQQRLQSHQPEESGVMVPSAGASSHQAEHMKQYLQWQKEKQHLQQQLRDKSLSYFEAKEQYARYQHHNEVIQMEYDFIQHQCVDLCDQMLQELHHNLAFFQEYHSRKKMRK